MKNIKHTPWKAIDEDVYDSENVLVAECVPGTGPAQLCPDAVAVARLIAASPDLLEALKKALTSQGSMNSDVVHLCSAAIAKAEGKSE